MINLHTKFEVAVHPLRIYERQSKAYKLGWFVGFAVT